MANLKLRGTGNGRAKMTWDKVRRLRAYFEQYKQWRNKRWVLWPDSMAQTAREEKIALPTLWAILHNKTWIEK